MDRCSGRVRAQPPSLIRGIHRPMRRLKILGFAGALVVSAIVGGTLMSTVLANPGNAPTTATDDGGGLAVDAQPGAYCQAFLDEFAKQLGVDVSALTPAAKAAADAAI